jgi:DNA-binding NarL/FixJ family response regulator
MTEVCAARLYIVDEHDSIRLALAEYLDRASNLTVVGHTANVDDALEEIREAQLDVVLVEVKRTDGMGLEIVRKISRLPDAPQLIVFTSYPTKWEEDAATRAGASLYVLKDIKSDELVEHISELAEHA